AYGKSCLEGQIEKSDRPVQRVRIGLRVRVQSERTGGVVKSVRSRGFDELLDVVECCRLAQPGPFQSAELERIDEVGIRLEGQIQVGDGRASIVRADQASNPVVRRRGA